MSTCSSSRYRSSHRVPSPSWVCSVVQATGSDRVIALLSPVLGRPHCPALPNLIVAWLCPVMARVVVVPGLAVHAYAELPVRHLSDNGHAAKLLDPPGWRGVDHDLERYGRNLAADID